MPNSRHRFDRMLTLRFNWNNPQVATDSEAKPAGIAVLMPEAACQLSVVRSQLSVCP